MNKKSHRNWHEMTEARALESLHVEALEGLSHAEAENRKKIHGTNRLTTKKGKSPLVLFFSQFHDSLIYILLASALITGLLKSWLDAGVIFAVVFLNAVIGFIQEFNALRAIDALSRVLSISAAVLRDGLRKVIPAAELVPGDIVFLQSGDKVPADLRLIKLRDLQIDESALTGESVPVEKRTGSLSAGTVLAERSNMAYSSTLVTFGTAVGIVVETGDHTELGRINRLIAEAADLETPLTGKIRQFSRLLMWFILGLALMTFLAG
jgi:cation-transporting ATPase F